MTIDELMRSVLSPFGLEIARSVYLGSESKYLVYNYSTLPIDFGDDEPGYERYLVQVHVFAPLEENINSLVREIKSALFKADFTFPEMEDASSADERHIVIETEIALEVQSGQL